MCHDSCSLENPPGKHHWKIVKNFQRKMNCRAGKVKFCFLSVSSKQLRLCWMVHLKTISNAAIPHTAGIRNLEHVLFYLMETPKTPNFSQWVSFCKVSEVLKLILVSRKRIYFCSNVYSDVLDKNEGLIFFVMHLRRPLLVTAPYYENSIFSLYISTLLNKILVLMH